MLSERGHSQLLSRTDREADSKPIQHAMTFLIQGSNHTFKQQIYPEPYLSRNRKELLLVTILIPLELEKQVKCRSKMQVK